jgi:hypothetical protein
MFVLVALHFDFGRALCLSVAVFAFGASLLHTTVRQPPKFGERTAVAVVGR